MNILMCSPVSVTFGNKSGIHIRIEEIAKYFKKNGHSIKLVDTINPNIIKNYKYIYCLISTKSDSISSKVVNLHAPNALLITDLYTPILLEKDLTYFSHNPLDYITRKKQVYAIKKILIATTYFIVANKRQKAYWLKTSKNLSLPIIPKNISVIPTGYPETIVKSKPQNTVLWFGGVYPWLNPAPLAEAFSQIAHNFPNWKLKIIGAYYPGTGYKSLYEEFKRKLQNIPKNQIEIIPWQKPQSLKMSLHDVSFSVHLPQRTKEDYYAHRVRLLTLTNFGIPIATSGQDIISKIIVNSKAGWNISNNTLSLKKQLAVLMKDKSKVLKASNNTQHVQERLIKQQLSDKIFSENIYSL